MYQFSCRGRHPLTLEKGLAFSQNRIWSWSFSSTSVTEGEWVSRHSWSRQWPVHTDFRELWQTCGNWTTFYKVLCAMVCRVKDKDFFWFCFPLCFAIFLLQFSVFFSWLSFLSGVATAASLHPRGRHWLSITRTIWTSQLLRCSKISHLCLFIYFINML